MTPATDKGQHVALLVVGDPFGATTHSDLCERCHSANIPVHVAHNASIMNAIGVAGLQLYRYGQTLSLCFWTDSWRPASWYDRLLMNRAVGCHTLLLLDIKVKEVSDENLARGRKIYEPPRFMTVKQAAQQLLEVERIKGLGAVTEDTICIGVARVGTATQKILAAPLKVLAETDMGEPLHSMIVAGNIHECEMDHAMLHVAEGGAEAGAVTREMMKKNSMAPEARKRAFEMAAAGEIGE
jgi:diphthine synthase